MSEEGSLAVAWEVSRKCLGEEKSSFTAGGNALASRREYGAVKWKGYEYGCIRRNTIEHVSSRAPVGIEEHAFRF